MKFDIGVAENCGLREHMEDRFYFDPNFRDRGELFAGVYDGHGGDTVAELVKQEIHLRFLASLDSGVNFLDAFTSAYEIISDEVRVLEVWGGSCAANFILSHGKVYFANAGDVRILVVGPSVEQLTIDHHPDNSEEKDRIKKCGGIIERKRITSVFGSIALSRSIGDYEYESLGLISTPYTGIHLPRSTDLALVVATDGVFEKMTNLGVAQIVRNGQDAQSISNSIIEAALKSGTKDNVTALTVKFIKT